MILEKKTIIVTGAGSGIGKELAIQLIEKKAIVVALDISGDNLKELKKSIKKKKSLITYELDISDFKAIDKLYKELKKDKVIVDGIINNAGIIQPFIEIKDMDFKTINKVMDVNFYGPLYLTKKFLSDLLELESASIVNVSSMGGFFPFPKQSIYGASKAALKLYSEALYAELLDTNVSVTTVLPGAVNTNINKNSNVEMKNNKEEVKMKLLEPNIAAEKIIDAIEKNKFRLFLGSDSKIMNLMYKFNSKGAIKLINKKMKDYL